MWRKRKFIIILLGAVLIIAAGIGGVAMAQESEEDSQPDTLLARVARILGIDQQTVEDAFEQAKAEMHEEALDRYLQDLVDEGIISEEKAAEYKAWLESRPDIPDMPRSKIFGIFRDRGGMRMFDGLCLPSQ